MSALAIALHVLVAAAGAPALHLETPLALGVDPAPDLAMGTAVLHTAEYHVVGVRPRPWAKATFMTVFGEVAFASGIAFAAHPSARDAYFSPDLAPIVAGCAVALAFAPPAFAIWGAERGGAPGERSGTAYGKGMLARLVGAGAAFGLAAGAQSLSGGGGWGPFSRPVLFGTLAVSELIVMPWVVVRTLGDVPEVAAPDAPIDAPASARARPVRDPALASR